MSLPVKLGWAPGRFTSVVALLVLLFAVERTSVAADPREYAVEISVDVLAGPFALQLNWPSSGSARQYIVSRRGPGESTWGTPIATLPANSTGYTDFNVSVGTVYEYQVRMELNLRGSSGAWLNAYGYVFAGGNIPFADSRGKALLVVDSTVASGLANELATYQKDLVASGWSVVRRDVSRGSSPVEVRNQIKAEHTADPFNLRSVILIGHVPVPYSGNIAPDLHESHRGAWPADGFYGELDGTWTDSTVNVTSFDSEDNDNRPGDGKFDQSEFPSPVDLEVGRIDFWNLPAFAPRTELDLLRNYFRKNHAFRHRAFTAARRGLIRDNFGDLDGDAPAVDAWRHYAQFFGQGAISEVGAGAFFPTLASESFLWAYGCGGGGYTKADGVGSTSDFAVSDPRTVFLILHGSYFGDWNNTDNFLRAAIATPNYTLASIWSGLPHWYMHPMGLGASVGYCTRLTQNNFSDYKSYQNFSPGQVHISLLGDPTLEMYPVVPPSNLTASPGAAVSLNWGAAAEENLVGYHVYHSTSANGPFQRITSNPLTTTSHSHNPGAGTHHYMVRSLKLERTGSGTFYNLSHGITATVIQGSGGTVPAVTLTTTDNAAGEAGPDPGEFRFSRGAGADQPLTIDFLIGGTAQNGVDYAPIPSSVTIPAGSAEVSLAVVPLADTLDEGEETLTLQIRPSSSYTVGSPSVGFLRISDAPANQPPAISAIPDQAMDMDSSVTVSFQISDPETAPDSLNVRALSSNLPLIPQSGLVFGGAGASRTLRIIPAPGATGTSTITVLVSDGNIEVSRTFEVAVTRPNLPPTAQSQTITTLKNTATPLVLGGNDPEGAPLTFAIKSSPTNGTLSGAAPTLTYTPLAGAIGQDSFTFSVSDGQAESPPATVTIEIVETNRPPVALPDEVTMDEDAAVTITLTGLDPDGDPLQFDLVTGTTQGVLTGRGQVYQYKPVENAHGADSFSFRVSDGEAVSAPAVVSIAIRPVNDAPVAVSSTVQFLEDEPASALLTASDPDGDLLTYQIVSPPTKGQITGTPPNLIFTPTGNVFGSDSFSFKVADGKAESSVATVTLSIAPVNDPPLAVGKTLTTPEDVPVSVSIGGTDADGDALTFRLVSSPFHGLLSGSPPNLLYTPNANFSGEDSFTFTVSDGAVESAPATISLSVEPRNDPPTLSPLAPQLLAKNRDLGPLALSVQDVDKPIGELLVMASSSHTNVVRSESIRLAGDGTNRSLTITPEPGATGTTIITVTVSDGEAQAQSSFLLTITNTPPVALPDALTSYGSVLEIPTAQLTGNDSDPDGDPLQIVAVASSELGRSVELRGNTVVYHGTGGTMRDSFSYIVEDNSGGQAGATVTITFTSGPRVETISISGNSITLRVSGAPLSTFRVQASVDAGNWQTVGEATTDPNGQGEFREDGTALEHRRFYRVEWP